MDKTFAVHFSGVNEEIRNSQYGALKVKDAIVDSFTRNLTNARRSPSSSRIFALTSSCSAIWPAWRSI